MQWRIPVTCDIRPPLRLALRVRRGRCSPAPVQCRHGSQDITGPDIPTLLSIDVARSPRASRPHAVGASHLRCGVTGTEGFPLVVTSRNLPRSRRMATGWCRVGGDSERRGPRAGLGGARMKSQT
ncbi:hypothetical protein A176_003916 [Myxococcus hansupus]|uniref:Uncharacterized protein n=1 Tax=Pseudomyxococcus hansupus TaxID=1297742 RepID=A0A0H4WW24_9BACT|nr:hypothetical protein A176_003916 [Myxococcus hansupus]